MYKIINNENEECGHFRKHKQVISINQNQTNDNNQRSVKLRSSCRPNSFGASLDYENLYRYL